ncbi:MAG TPA: FKBP-type peptidyl-prolyl cis-trans isomerase [Verrucomicrobiae bacterium]|nr:FKBP-type peptidyl-prolyl cis-trans isomerase [Verrucomicrobiae bacterium]
MTKRFFTILGLGLVVLSARGADEAKPDDKNPFKDERERVSYALGMMNGMQMKRGGLDIDTDAFSKGIKDGNGAGPTLLTEQQARETMMKWQQEMRAKQMEKQKVLGEKNKKEGEEFLAKNKSEPGVITLPSGLQYKVTKDGSGDNPKSDDTVTVNYKGTLIDGTEFDSSEKTGHPATFNVRGVIPGWTEALQLMKPGAKWKLFIPSTLAYKERGMPPNIGPDATLIFDIELVSATHPAPAPPPQPLTSDIIKVPSAEELKRGAKIETIKPEDIEKEKAKEAEKAKTNSNN